jgi:hypothetical protein
MPQRPHGVDHFTRAILPTVPTTPPHHAAQRGDPARTVYATTARGHSPAPAAQAFVTALREAVTRIPACLNGPMA